MTSCILLAEANGSILDSFWHNFSHNLFKPLLLFFYMGFLIPLLRIKFEFPHALYQGITMYLLVAIGWKGGEELASVGGAELGQALGFMVIGFILNTIIGFATYRVLRTLTRLRKVDAATVAGYYGSDSAGTFATCVGVLTALQIAYAAYMPVMLAVMEIPGCLVALVIVATLRNQGMDANGAMPGEEGYGLSKLESASVTTGQVNVEQRKHEEVVAVAKVPGSSHDRAEPTGMRAGAYKTHGTHEQHGNGHDAHAGHGHEHSRGNKPVLSAKVLHEVFLNPGLYLLFGGIAIGFLSRLQGTIITEKEDNLFVTLFQGVLCLFLLEMGITACKRLRDLRTAGTGFIVFGLLAPNVFATTGILVAHMYSHTTGMPFELGTYLLFAVLCGAASYIAVPAVQRLAIPEASPTLPLAASLGLTFSYNVTIGIPVYLEIAKAVMRSWPVTA